MNRTFSVSKKVLIALCYLVAIALSIKSFREPDLWWQIRTGQWILQHHAIPHEDVFSYTFNGAPWINIKWGFEVLAAVVSDLFGAESVFIIQAFISCLILFFLLKLSGLFLDETEKSEEPFNISAYSLSTSFAILITFIAIEYRIIGRPEMISHLMTVLFLFILEKNRQSPTKILYLIIPLQIIWANFHEAFGIGFVILLIYTVIAWIESRYQSGPKDSSLRKNAIQLSLVTVAAIASVAINPNGLKLFASPFNIMGQIYSNKYTTELLSFTSPLWWQKEAWLGLSIFLIGIIGVLFKRLPDNSKKKKGKERISGWWNKKAYLLCMLAFLYLSLTAYRNLIFLSLVCFPVFHSTLFSFFKKWIQRYLRFHKISFAISLSLLFSFYILIVSNQYYKLTDSRDRFGLEVLSNFNPTGASDFIRDNNLLKKKGFSDYLTSSYLLWKLQPEFKTFIDLRDLDVFSAEFLDKFFDAVNNPQKFHKLDSIERFDYVVLYQGQFPYLHDYLYNDSIYALKYVDAVAAVYEKTDVFTRDDIFSQCQPVKQGTFSMNVNRILNPFYNSYNYSKNETDFIAASYYINVSRPDLATKRAEKCTEDKRIAFKGYALLGQINYNYALQDSSHQKQEELLRTAEQYYLQSLRFKKDYGYALFGLGVINYSLGNYSSAISYFKRCEQDKEIGEQAKIYIDECRKAMRSK